MNILQSKNSAIVKSIFYDYLVWSLKDQTEIAQYQVFYFTDKCYSIYTHVYTHRLSNGNNPPTHIYTVLWY